MNAPEMVKMAEEKISAPLFGVAIRVTGQDSKGTGEVATPAGADKPSASVQPALSIPQPPFWGAHVLERIGAEGRLPAARAAWRKLEAEAAIAMQTLREFETMEVTPCVH